MIEFIGPLYNMLQHFTNHYLWLDTLNFWPHYTNPLLQLNCQLSQGQSHWQSVSKSWFWVPSGAHDQIFITVWQLWSCFCQAHSLTRGWVCLLYMLLALASAVFLRSKSFSTCNHILLSQIWDFPLRCRLQLAGSQWRYSTLPPHGFWLKLSKSKSKSKSKSHCDWRSVSQ
jgi:hypothetical protein